MLSTYAYEGNLQVVKRMIANGEDVNKPDTPYSSANPLIFACFANFAQPKFAREKYAVHLENCFELVSFLLENGADPDFANQKAEYWFTPLHAAAKNRNPRIVSLLFEYGANPNIKDAMGNTPLFYAMTANVTPPKILQKNVVQALIDAGGKVSNIDKALELVAYNGHLQFVKDLLKWGVSQAAMDSALYNALAKYYPDVAMELLNAGAKPKRIGDDHFKESTLHRAVRCGSIEVVTKLLNLGADPLDQDKDGKTSIDKAKNMFKLDIARLLKEKAEQV